MLPNRTPKPRGPRTLLSLLAFTFLLLAPSTHAFPQYLGDLNEDNKVDVRDLVILINHLNQTTLLTDPLPFFADVNQDGFLNQSDVDALSDIILGKQPAVLFPFLTPSETSPANGEGDVSVNRETIFRFSQPLSTNTVLTTNRIYATFGGRRLLSRIELATDRKTITLFFLEPIPSSARVRVTFNDDGLQDFLGRPLDLDGDGAPGGIKLVDFDTHSNTAVPGTAVIGTVYASEQVPGTNATNFINHPLAGVTITVDGMEETLRAVTDANGHFILNPCPVGEFFVHIDGRTLTNVPAGIRYPDLAYYPFVGKSWTATAGRTNFAGFMRGSTNAAATNGSIFLPLIVQGTLQPVSMMQDTMITFPASVLALNPTLAGTMIMVPANSLYSDNGARGGMVGIAPVPPDRPPGPLPPGLNFPLVITVQTSGPENFARPVPVRFPNLPDPITGERLPPGAKSGLWSFNHDTGRWEIQGPMTVTADGLFVESDPGIGIRQPGWHGARPATIGGCDPLIRRLPVTVGRPPRPIPPPVIPFHPSGSCSNLMAYIFVRDCSIFSPNIPTTNAPSPQPILPRAVPACGGIDCGCELTGSYSSPRAPVPLSTSSEPVSYFGSYELRVVPGPGQTQLTVWSRTRNQTALSVQVPTNSFWGFGPASRSFVYYFHRDGAWFIALHDLSRSRLNQRDPPVPVATGRLVSSSPPVIGFSPDETYFLFGAATGPSEFRFSIAHTESGRLAYAANLVRTRGTGLPDFTLEFASYCASRSFIYTVRDGSNPKRRNLVNLDQGQLVYSDTLASGSDFWRVSPCGDAVVLADNIPNGVFVRLIATASGFVRSTRSFSLAGPFPSLSFHSTLASHLATVSGSEQFLANNTADLPCAGGNRIAALQEDSDPADVVELEPSLGRHYFAVYDWLTGRVTQRGQTPTTGIGHVQLILPANQLFGNYMLRADTLEVGKTDFVSGDVGTAVTLPPVLLEPDVSPDSDGDGLTDLAEAIVGTNPNHRDSDGDGTPDGAEVQQGTDPVDGLPVATGVVGAADTPGDAQDVCAINNVAIVADFNDGVSVFRILDGLNPVRIAQVDTPGVAVRISCSGNLIAVADSDAGLAVLDVTDPPAARILHQLNFGSSAQAVTTAGGFAFVGLNSGEVVSVDMATGTEINRVSLGSPVVDVALGGEILYALTAGRLYALVLEDGLLQPAGSADSPNDGKRLFVGDSIAYVTHTRGYHTFSLTNASLPVLIAAGVTAQFGWQHVVDNGSGLGVAASGVNGPEDVFLYDVRDPRQTDRFLGTLPTPGQARAVSIYNGLAYVADGAAGLQVVNYLAFDTGTNPPTIAIATSFPLTNPTNGAVEEGKFVRVTARVTDDVQVRNVEFYFDDALVLTDGNFPFELRLVSPALAQTNSFRLRAKATDTGGNATWSEEILVTLTGDLTPPRLVRTVPPHGTITNQLDTIFAFFNEPIDPASVTPANFRLATAGPDGRFGTVDDVIVPNGVITFRETLNAALIAFTQPLPMDFYRLEVANIRDIPGTVMTAPTNATFAVLSGGPSSDADGDDVSNSEELLRGTNPLLADSDGDGVDDGEEVAEGTDPLNPDFHPTAVFVARPLVDVFLPGTNQVAGANGLTVARPPVEVSLPATNQVAGAAGLTVARPLVDVFLPGTNQVAGANGLTVARPPVEISLPATNQVAGAGLTVARPLVDVFLPGTNQVAGANGLTMARPPVEVSLPATNQAAGAAGLSVGQPPVSIRIPRP